MARRTRALAGLLVALHLALVIGVSRTVRSTADEPAYVNVGRALVEEPDWSEHMTRLQGPVALFANQLFVDEFPAGGLQPRGGPRSLLLRARLGMTVFALVGALVVFAFARDLFGERGSLIALAAYALHPLVVGHGALATIDTAHATTTLLAAWLGWRAARAPGPWKIAACGATLGVALATKYLVVLYAPVVVAAIAVGVWRARERARVATTLGALVGLIAVALVASHGCYLFRAGFSPTDPDAYDASAFAAIAGTPVLGWLLALLPAPMVLGLDYQLSLSDALAAGYLRGAYAASHATYYVWGMLAKTPEVLLVFGLVWAFGVVPGTLRGARGERERTGTLYLLGVAALPFAYLGVSGLQAFRYAMPFCSIGAILLGGLGPLVDRIHDARVWRVLVGIALVAFAVELRAEWPNLVNYNNASSGARARTYLFFKGPDADWGHYLMRGSEVLRERGETDFEELPPNGGPRFGRVLANERALTRRDTVDPSRSYHWLLRFDPIARVGGAWWLFDVTPEEWEARLEQDDARGRKELAIAHAGAGNLERARELASELAPEVRSPLERLCAIADSTEPALAAERALLWLRFGRHGLTLEALDAAEAGGITDGQLPTLRAQALVSMGRKDEARTVLEGWPGLKSSPEAMVVLARVMEHGGDYRAAIALLEEGVANGLAGDRLDAIRVTLDRLRMKLENALRLDGTASEP